LLGVLGMKNHVAKKKKSVILSPSEEGRNLNAKNREEVKVSVPSKAQAVQPVKVWSEERLATTSVENSA